MSESDGENYLRPTLGPEDNIYCMQAQALAQGTNYKSSIQFYPESHIIIRAQSMDTGPKPRTHATHPTPEQCFAKMYQPFFPSARSIHPVFLMTGGSWRSMISPSSVSKRTDAYSCGTERTSSSSGTSSSLPNRCRHCASPLQACYCALL